MENTEKLIIEQLKKGNEDIYRYIYDYHYGILCHVADQYVRDSFLAETIVGDVIFHIWEVRDSLQITTSLRSYLVKAVRNRCIGYMNLEYNQKEIAFSALLPEETPENRFIQSDDYPLGLLLEKELENEIYKSINKLPPECRSVFEKSRFEGKKYEEISKELGISVNTVKYHIKSALSFLRKELDKYLLLLTLLFLQ
ncbi:MAG: RNA polymerase sigma-70 factor [Tannerellaceae bacterium]|nr:RNA polymerase sigma-70 factor [Tannerellaceae bacterium]